MRFKIRVTARSLVSLTILFWFLVMLITSILMFSQKHHISTALIHTIVGFALILIIFWHLKNNFLPLKQHFRLYLGRQHKKINMSMPLAVLFCSTLVGLAMFQFPPFLQVYEWGNTLRAGSTEANISKLSYIEVDKIQDGSSGPKLTVDMRKGPYFAWPQYAIWIETMAGDFIQPIYVTSSIAKNNFTNKVSRKDNNIVFDSHILFSGKVNPNEVFDFGMDAKSKNERMRPESLPVFLHKLGKKTATGIVVPSDDNSLSDAFTGATLTSSFILRSQLRNMLEDQFERRFRVRFEINHSFDFNEYYSSDKFPEDEIYSGSGYSAQPSVVYEAIIDLGSNA